MKKLKAIVTIPEGEFTFAELVKANPQFVTLTLRVLITRAIQNSSVQVVGQRPHGQRRPSIVYRQVGP